MTQAEKVALRIEREELCQTYGFDNRWTAMIFQWCMDALGPAPEGTDSATVAEDCREYVLEYKGVPEERLGGVNFHDIALAMIED